MLVELESNPVAAVERQRPAASSKLPQPLSADRNVKPFFYLYFKTGGDEACGDETGDENHETCDENHETGDDDDD